MRCPVLVVEDDPTLCAVLAQALEDDGFEVMTAADLRRARYILFESSHPVGVLVLDLALPDGDGERLLSELSGANHAPPTVVMSALGVRADQAGETFGVPRASKPLDLALMTTTVAVALENDLRPRDPSGGHGRPSRRLRVA